MRALVTILAVAALAACADPTCRALGDAEAVLASSTGSCRAAHPKITEASCEAGIGSCNDVDRQAIGNLATCLTKLPACTPDSEDDYDLKLAGCAFKLLPASDRCLDATRVAPAATGEETPDAGSEPDAGSPPDAGVEPSARFRFRIKNSLENRYFWITVKVNDETTVFFDQQYVRQDETVTSPTEVSFRPGYAVTISGATSLVPDEMQGTFSGPAVMRSSGVLQYEFRPREGDPGSVDVFRTFDPE